MSLSAEADRRKSRSVTPCEMNRLDVYRFQTLEI